MGENRIGAIAAARPPAATAFRPPSPVATAPMSARPAPAPRPIVAAPAPLAEATTTTALADEPLDQSAEVQAKWREALASINQRKRLLGAFLEESTFLGAGGGRVVVCMDDLHRAVVEEKDNRTIVADEVRRVFGEVTLHCAPLGAAGPLPERPSEEQTEAMVAKALAWFGSDAPAPRVMEERTEG